MTNYLLSVMNIILTYFVCDYFMDMVSAKRRLFDNPIINILVIAVVPLTGFFPMNIVLTAAQDIFICMFFAISFFKSARRILNSFILLSLYFIANLMIIRFWEYIIPARFSIYELIIYKMLLEYLISVLIKAAYSLKQKGADANWTAACTICIPVGTLFITLVILLSDITKRLSVICICVLVIINGVFYMLLKMFINIFEKSLSNIVLNEQIKAYKHQLNYSMNSSNEFKAVRHDIKNNLNTIKTLISNGNTDDVISFIDEINGSDAFNKIFIDSGNEIIDSIINYKISEAGALGIMVDHNIKIPATLDVNSFDITVIIGNLLDNAITAVSDLSETQNRRFSINIIYSKGSLIIDVTNPTEAPHHEFKKGIGLTNVETMVKKYHGEIVITSADNMFKVQLVIII